MNTVVVGGGLGGLTSALLLSKNHAVRLVERCSRGAVPSVTKYLGIWSPALDILHAHDLLDGIPVEMVRSTSYRAVDGVTLAEPSFPLDAPRFSGQPALGFVDEGRLKDRLLQRCLDAGVRCHFNTSAHTLEEGQVLCSDGESLPADLVVVADGPHSHLKQLVRGRAAIPEFRGYSVFRGVSERQSDDAFQTWGAGRRFAVVPAPHNQSAWFAAVSEHLLPKGMHDLNRLHDTERVNTTLLSELFKGWHEPIPRLINTTRGGVLCERAEATAKVDPRGPGSDWYGGPINAGVAFIGDAAHALDPILAQGAGVAIEDAARLAGALEGLGSGKVDASALGSALKAMDQGGVKRLRVLHALSKASQGVGHLNNHTLVRARDFVMRGVPRALKTPCFDAAVRMSVRVG